MYRSKLKARLYNGSSPQLEVLLHYYAYGKPKTVLDVNDNRVTVVHVHREPVPQCLADVPVPALPVEDRA